ncbi:polymorphic toxin-type HINT domain-containing protein [Streptomyces sp. NPDC051445]|uniref:polymorphic toxin-type HINT domain-containing protein n=1 Tax=Streptomyces sp. NPDC051445 TaxID=3365653 RepID=UPI0037A0D969
MKATYHCLTGRGDCGEAIVSDIITVASFAFGSTARSLLARGASRAAAAEVESAAATLLREACSFSPDTPVLLENGETKAISKVEPGDEVEAADPDTGRHKGSKSVTARLVHHDYDLVDVTVRTADGGTSTIHTTASHPFWDDTLHTWTDAGHLQPGHRLNTATNHHVQVVAVTVQAGSADMYNLTVDDLHTYYVLAGETPVLVHNSNCGIRQHDKARGAAGVDEMMATFEKFYKKSDIYSESYGNGLDLWTPYGRREVDIAVRNPDGNLHLYEVKVNKSNYTRGQRRKDEWLAKTYGFETSVVRRGTACPICNP